MPASGRSAHHAQRPRQGLEGMQIIRHSRAARWVKGTDARQTDAHHGSTKNMSSQGPSSASPSVVPGNGAAVISSIVCWLRCPVKRLIAFSSELLPAFCAPITYTSLLQCVQPGVADGQSTLHNAPAQWSGSLFMAGSASSARPPGCYACMCWSAKPNCQETWAAAGNSSDRSMWLLQLASCLFSHWGPPVASGWVKAARPTHVQPALAWRQPAPADLEAAPSRRALSGC